MTREKQSIKGRQHREFPSNTVVKTSPSNAGGVRSIPGRGAKIPHASQPKTKKKKKRKKKKKKDRKKKKPEAIL